jgi:hypothetical protein
MRGRGARRAGSLMTRRWREMDSNPRSPVKKNPLVETVLFDISGTSLSRETEEAVWPPPKLALGPYRISGRITRTCAGGSPEENSAALDQA